MLPFLTNSQIRALYLEVVKHPSFAGHLRPYHASEVRQYAAAQEDTAWRTACTLMDSSPDYPYPEAYRNGREMEHFFERSSTGQESQAVQQSLLTYPPQEQAPQLLSVRQAASMLGLSRSSVRALIKSGQLPAQRIDTFTVVALPDVLAAIEAKNNKANQL